MTYPTVNVSGEYTVSETPDLAVVSFAIVSQDDDQSVVVSELDDVSRTVTAALEDHYGLSEEVTTQEFSVDRQTHRGDHDPENDYKGVHSYSVTLRDTEKVGDVIDTVVTNGADMLENVEFKLAQSTYEECREKAIRSAVRDARQEAEVAAATENLEPVSVVEMTVNRTHRNPVNRNSGVMLAMSSQDMSTDVQNENVSVSATVDVEYNLD